MAIDKKYLQEAMEMLDGGYNSQRVQLQNSFNQNTQSLEGQKAGVNQNFDNQLQQNTINTTKSTNAYNNQSLARGLGRSTIATSGQAGIRDSGNRIANLVETDRTNAMANIEAQKVQLNQALQESLLGLETKKQSEALSMAQQLEAMMYQREQDKWANDFKREQFEYQKSQDALARSLAASRGRSGGSGSSGGGKSGGSGGNYSESQMWSEFNKHLAADLKEGSYESGRFAEKIRGQNPQAAAEMEKLYREARNKRGNVKQQTAKSTNANKNHQVY